MAKFEIQREYRGKSSSECYQACIRTATAAGYAIFKKRDIASLVICNGSIQGSSVELSLIVPLGSPTRVQLSFSAERCGENDLQAESQRVFAILEREIKA